ncbi:hypothetical protein NOR_07015 [Metarhizium rileyi]|uniref:Uncharacterized protein n=1 Tax=Metarhizium rileyi (strain RCEF 4871) TaxID=1649241 RepID=A0A166Z7S9_METRR|nr:hypothetical protein NOR_07015 [Metarhizium rileyi RCEF 4871]TWU73883.1 hypothetical protein ED733_002384 [Metarhizium rileyi]
MRQHAQISIKLATDATRRSSRSGRDGSGSPGGFHASHTSRLQDRRDNPHSFSSGAESVATGERLYHNGSAHAGYGPHTFDDYQAMPSTTETHASGYPATTAPIGSHAAVGDYAQDTWMLDVSTSAAGIAASFVGTSEAMYSDNAHAFANYSSHTSFDMYQHLDPNDDTRFWPENQNQH